MKPAITLLFILIHMAAQSQVIADFENYNLKPGTYLNNASPERGFESGSIFLPNDYNAEFDFWSGFAISADNDTTTAGFSNQYSSRAGIGALETKSYAMGYIFDPVVIQLKENAIGKPMISMYVSNSTYSYLSIRDGDGFAKKFGGETGNDPDYFLLTIKKYSGGVIADDSINIYLADYRFSDNKQDYILSDWKYVDLTVLGEVDSLILQLSSSDVGVFGMNTPAYVAIDQISTDNLLAAAAIGNYTQNLNYGPNPANQEIYLDMPFKGTCSIISVQGTLHWKNILEAGFHEINIGELPQGIYFISINGHFAGKLAVE